MKRPRSRSQVLLVAWAGAALAAGCLAASPASAASPPAGRVVVSPANGSDLSQITLTTSGPCRRGDYVQATVFGHGFGRFGQNVIGDSPKTMFATTSSGGMIIPLAGTMRYFANIGQVPVVLSGPYRFVVDCRTALSLTHLETFTSNPVTFTAAASGQRIFHTVNPVRVHTTQAAPPVNPDPYGTSTTVPKASKAAGSHTPSSNAGHGTGGGRTAAAGATGPSTGAGSSGGISPLTVVASILGAVVLAGLTGFVLVRRRRPRANRPGALSGRSRPPAGRRAPPRGRSRPIPAPPVRRPNVRSSTH